MRRPSLACKTLNAGHRFIAFKLDREKYARNVPSRWASTLSRFPGSRLQLVGIARTCGRRQRKTRVRLLDGRQSGLEPIEQFGDTLTQSASV